MPDAAATPLADLLAATRAWAAIQGRNYVLPDDVKFLAEPILSHRLLISPSARIKNVSPRQIVEDTLRHTPVPGARVKTR